MIYLIVGASCSGKTSFTYNSFLKGREFSQKRDVLDYCETDEAILLGKWISDTRTKGTDTINRKDIPLIGSQVEALLPLGKDIVLEGDKITSRNLFDKVLSFGVDVKLYLIDVPPEVSYERNVANNSTCTFSHLKAVTTKAYNIFMLYKDRMDGTRVDATNVEDFSNFGIGNYHEFEDESIWD